MGARNDVAQRLEWASLRFDGAGKTEQAVAIGRVAQALRNLPDELADDLVEEIVRVVEAGLR